MATESDREEKGFILQWKIENASNLWWLEAGEQIESPAFYINESESTKWALWLYPMGSRDKTKVGVYLYREPDCSGPDSVEVSYQLAFLRKDGAIFKERCTLNHKFSKDETWGFYYLETRDKVFVTEREAFIPEDTLTVQCTIHTINKRSVKPNRIFSSTLIEVKRKSFVWRIGKIGTLTSQVKNKFLDDFIRFDIILKEDLHRLNMYLTSYNKNIRYISCNTSVIDSKESKKYCETKKYFAIDLKKGALSHTVVLPTVVRENKSKYFPNDVLSLYFELVISTVKHIDRRKICTSLDNGVTAKEKCKTITNLNEDLNIMYRAGIFSDVEIRHSTKSFPVHKNILSSRSPVFKSMFSNDMKENSGGHVNITDFDVNTIRRMLLYIYTDSIEDLKFESACKLYKIAVKYQILSLKIKCSFFLEDNLSPTNACGVLVLADLYNDDDLKKAVQDYILRQNNQIFTSQEWEDFAKTHGQLASYIMYRKLPKAVLPAA